MLQQGAVSLSQLFMGALFRIPSYQRAYSWTEKQHKDLWDDLYSVFASSPTGSNHFLGTLVLEPRPDEQVRKHGKAFRVFEVIDGQQRLTALVVLVSCICRRLWPSPAAENLYDQFIAYCQDKKPDRTLQKVVLGKEDNDYFWDGILSLQPSSIEPRTPGQRRLKNAKGFFESKLSDFSDMDLVRYMDEVQTRLLLLTYQVGSELEAGLVFETINDRGKPLSSLDKIKNYLMYLASKMKSESLSATLSARWGDLLRNIAQINPERDDTEDEENSLVRYHWITETGDYRSYQIHREIKSKFRVGEAEAADRATQYIRNLGEASDLYLKIRHPTSAILFQGASQSTRSEIEYYLLWLNRLGTVANFTPLLMVALRKYTDEPETVKELARLCYLLAWRAYRVCGRRSDAGLGELSLLAYWMARSWIDVTTVGNRLKALIGYYSDDVLFKQNLEQNRLSSYEQRVLLYEWEVSLSKHTRQSLISWQGAQRLAVEHIWPQRPPGIDEWGDDLQEKHEKFVNRLGNLILISPPWNSQLSNRPLYEKEKVYAESNLVMVRSLLSHSDFSRVVQLEKGAVAPQQLLAAAESFVANRTSQLIEFALQRWHP
ncbi:DUF262 domain-containing HNH endonuclease family protein [Dehalococcoidales bacterium]|nr:DUF262 domain-containing HNH endonuclease family protein [Dehalococcoidales bacterium]